MTLEELVAQLLAEEQRAESEDLTGKLAPVLRRMRGYLELLDEVVSDPIDEQEQLIDANAAAGMLGFKRRYVWDHSRDFTFAYRIGNKWKYSPSGILRYLKRRAA